MKINFKHGSKSFTVEIDDGATLGDLRAEVMKITNVPPPMQKIVGKPNLNDNAKKLKDYGINSNTKLMLIGSPVADVVSVNDSESKATNEKRDQLNRNLPGNFWTLSPFAGLLADPFLEGKGAPLEGGDASFTLLIMDIILSRINTLGTNMATALLQSDAAELMNHPFLTLSPADRQSLAKLHFVIRKSEKFAKEARAAEKPNEVLKVVESIISVLESLPVDDFIVIPSGFIGSGGQNIMYLVVKKNKPQSSLYDSIDGTGETYALTICNRSPADQGGLDYHVHTPTKDKLKAKCCQTISVVSKERMIDPSFWLMTLSLWMKANNPQNLSEFCRAEVLYDVLLPWIVEKDPLKGNVVSGNIHSNNKKRCLAELIHSTDIIRTDSDPNYQNFSTTQRSTSGAVKSLMTAMQYILFSYGVSCETIKQIKFVIKYEFFLKGAEDLQLLAKKQLSLYIPTSGRIPCDNNDGDNLSPNSKSLLSLTEKSNDIVSSASALASSRSPSHSSGLRPLPKNLISLEAAVTNMKCNAGIDPKFTSLTIHHFFNEMDNPAVDFVKSAKNVIAPSSLFCNQGKVVVVYFGASWCNPCKTISSLVVNMYEHLQKRLPDIFSKVEFILVPLDKTREAAEEYGSKFPFHRVNFPPNNNIMKTFDISKIPTMLIFGSDGALMTSEGVKALMADPEATQFPVSPWNGAFPLTSTDLAMWKYSQQVLSHHALKKHDNNLFSDSHLRRIYTVMDAVQKVVEAMPYVDDDGEEVFPSSAVPFETETYSLNTGGDADEKCEETNLTTTSPFCEIPEESTQFMNSAMINHVRTDRYAGTSFNSRVPHMGDLSLFTVPTSMLELVKLLARSKEHVQKLWDMACHSGTSSRVAVQMQIIEFIVWLFTSVIPVPRPNDTDIASVVAKAVTPEEKAIASSFTRTNDRVYHSVTSTLYYEAFPTSQPAAGPQSRITNDTQISICHAIYFMMLSYATAWQAVESPTRSYDSERALVCMTMLTVYDVLCRNENGSSEGQMLASLMNHYNGGFFLSTTICKGMVSFSDTSSKFELTKPGNLAIRDAVIMQINFQKTKYKNELFDLRVPEKIEIRKYSHTVAFLRKFVENCGYRLDGREDEENAAEAQQQLGGQAGQELANVMRDRMGRSRGTGGMQIGGNEMEKLMFWFCDPKSLLATEHHEFGMVRDMVLLTKFMCTMEIRSSQLLRKKKEMDAFATWRLSFEEDTPGKQMSAGWRTNPKPPVWECLMVRGRDMDIADLVVKGFGDREISQYGEGLVLQSPIDASKHLNIDSPMEEDVLHATSLPTFANVLSQEEAEAFWSALTVPYMRIPLILDFFSTQDRHTYLFSPAIQTAFRAALFESGSYIPLPTSETHFDSQFEIPLRLNANQRREAELQKMMLQGAKGDTTSLLGTTYGLLLNELLYSPQSVICPLLHILRTIEELGPSSLYSVNATYVLYLTGIACDVVRFVQYAVEMMEAYGGDNGGVGCNEVDDSNEIVSPTVNGGAYQRRHMKYLKGSQDAIEEEIHTFIFPLLKEWMKEAEDNDDIPSQCVIHSYIGMIWRGTALAERNPSCIEKKAKQANALWGLLRSCAFVRARHGFGMGIQRTQLAAQEGDNMLTAEERLMRFLQSQGLNTKNVNREALEQGRRMMMSGGRMRAVFVQIRSRNYSDTVRVPNLQRLDPTSASESKALKLPPMDVPENVIFGILQENFTLLSAFVSSCSGVGMDESHPLPAGAAGHRLLPLNLVINKIVSTVLKDRIFEAKGTTDHAIGDNPAASAKPSTSVAASSENRWVCTSPGVYISPTSGLVFHLHTCELFWKDEELKPVPDSMSHYTDYETILGKDVVQCGLVSRTQHRHWVHVVGTPYDLIEWSAPEPADQGVYQPQILMGPPDVSTIEEVRYHGESYNRPVNCLDEEPWPERGERWAVNLVKQVFSEAYSPEMKFNPMMPRSKFEPSKAPNSSSTSSRVRSVVLVDKIRMIYTDLLQYPDETDRQTWKEIVVTRETKLVLLTETRNKHRMTVGGPYPGYDIKKIDIRMDIFTLVPHARKMYRVLHFTTNQRNSLASLSVITKPRLLNEYFKTLRNQCGDLKSRVRNEGTLAIHRYNQKLNGKEVYIPPRLLQGVVPSSLLENLLFWHGEDDVLRGYPACQGSLSLADVPNAKNDKEIEGKSSPGYIAPRKEVADDDQFASHWFNYTIEIELYDGAIDYLQSGSCSDTAGVNRGVGHFRVIRRNDGEHRTIREKAANVSDAALTGEVLSDAHRVQIETGVNFLRSTFDYPTSVFLFVLKKCRYNVSEAMDWLRDSKNKPIIQTLLSTPDEETPATAPEGMSQCSDPSTGIGCNSVNGLSRTRSVMETMKRVATITTNDEETGESDGGIDGTGDTRCAIGVGEGEERERVYEGPLELIRIHDTPRFAALARLLQKIEDNSHILVWGRQRQFSSLAHNDDDMDPSSSYDVHIIELPRLRAKFQPKKEDLAYSTLSKQHGNQSQHHHLWLVDHPCWRVATSQEIRSDCRIINLMRPWDQSILMKNVSTSEMALFVPNHDFARMVVKGDPMNRTLLFDRSSMQWIESVPSPFYLIPLHTSRQFLIPPSLSASLYATALMTAKQEYALAMKLVESCYVDTSFTVDEQFMFSLMGRTLTSASGTTGDNHPDAHAVRLKFAHSAMYSPNDIEWPLHVEVTKYILKIRHVSRQCVLTMEELTDVMKRCNQSSPLMKCQLDYWIQMSQGKPSARIKPPDAEFPGRPWQMLQSLSSSHIERNCIKITRLQYKKTKKPLHEEELVDLIWKDTLLQDEESGSNSSMGFFFLYELKRLRTAHSMKLIGKDATPTMDTLLSRCFHLRHNRWGKQVVHSGESEVQPSFAMSVLATMETFPNAQWPEMNDNITLHRMSRGIDVNSNPNSWNRTRDGRYDDDDDSFRSGFESVAIAQTPLALFVRSLEQKVSALRKMTNRDMPQMPERAPVMVPCSDYIVPRVNPSNTSQNSITITGIAGNPEDNVFIDINRDCPNANIAEDPFVFNAKTAASMVSHIFEEIDLFSEFLEEEGVSKSQGDDDNMPEVAKVSLPFDISDHPIAQSHIAKDMLSRLEEDVNTYHKQILNTRHFSLTALRDSNGYIQRLFADAASYVRAKAEGDVRSLSLEDHDRLSQQVNATKGSLLSLINALTALQRRDEALVGKISKRVLDLANNIHGNSSLLSSIPVLIHRLGQKKKVVEPVTVEWLCGVLLSSTMMEDLAKLNPFHGDIDEIRTLIIWLMLFSNRGQFCSQTIVSSQQLLRYMGMISTLNLLISVEKGKSIGSLPEDTHMKQENLFSALKLFALQFGIDYECKSEDGSSDLSLSPMKVVGIIAKAMISRLSQLVSTLVDQLSVKRHYITATSLTNSAIALQLDPRFLVFEFIFNIILRQRQVEMIKWFYDNIKSGNSRVQQMIMGQGKTTVVGPILALMLADGDTLVTQVMPTALLEQSRTVLRKCFSVIMTKPIYTLQFDRSCDEGEEGLCAIEKLYQKLASAKKNRALIVSASECIKALFLKYVEQLHSIESLNDEDLEIGGNTAGPTNRRRQKEVNQVRKRAISRSRMADAIVPILQMCKQGVLIMDEVDVLLHPLRSELNFPIGLKHPIELSGPRWRLPMHILDGIFHLQRHHICTIMTDDNSDERIALQAVDDVDEELNRQLFQNSETPPQGSNQKVSEILMQIDAVIEKGLNTCALQRQPHLVLLDNNFYHIHMKGVVAKWAMIWLWRAISKEQLKERKRGESRQAVIDILADGEAGHSHRNDDDSQDEHPHLLPYLTQENFEDIASIFLLDSRRMATVTPCCDTEQGISIQPEGTTIHRFVELMQLGEKMKMILLPSSIQLLFLAREWLDTLLPHVLSKINRVSFGVLQTSDFAVMSSWNYSGNDSAIPLSRRLMAVPFVAKDVPSRSSEFAHPDVVIGLTVLAYRYEGMRISDVKQLLLQLKQDYSRQTGPRERRPASALYNRWLKLAREASTGHSGDVYACAAVPLAQLQVMDPTQLNGIYRLLRRVPEVIHYYLSQHVFPRTMNFQRLKLSACGHELGSDILFTKRIGFSGTPSNLLPLDLGECSYEPGSDGKILSVLTNPAITTCEELSEGWTPLKVLHQIATANPSYHALIDTGALITDMENEQVARYLLAHLPPATFEGVVFLDSKDRQVILQRSNLQIVPLAQCGTALSRRFTFFDQVHTTGMDIKQTPTATAVITIGKDMVFRDYAQGAFRMRGIGKGQKIRLFLIPEVRTRIQETLAWKEGPQQMPTSSLPHEIAVPAWLLLNAMRIEGLQFVKLCQQELDNIWRKKALMCLMLDSQFALDHPSYFTDLSRVRRFDNRIGNPIGAPRRITSACDNMNDLLTLSINEFREGIDYPVASDVEAPIPYADRVNSQVTARPHKLLCLWTSNLDAKGSLDHDGANDNNGWATELLIGEAPDTISRSRLDDVLGRMLSAIRVHGKETEELGLNTEVVHEQEAEEEQEQEAEQEEQRVSMLSRDDEQPIPWDVRILEHTAKDKNIENSGYSSPFYLCSQFQIRSEQPLIDVPNGLSLSDNFYRKRWMGLGDRKMKNCVVFLQWVVVTTDEGGNDSRMVQTGIVSLAEGETIRWLIHHNPIMSSNLAVSVRIVGSGAYMDVSRSYNNFMISDNGDFSPVNEINQLEGSAYDVCSDSNGMFRLSSFVESYRAFFSFASKKSSSPIVSFCDPPALWYRFYNCDMFYTPKELDILDQCVLNNVSPSDRVAFFTECLRLRRRHRNEWEDAPVAALFASPDDTESLRNACEFKKLRAALMRLYKEALNEESGENKGHTPQHHVDPAFMTEEEQIEMILRTSAAAKATVPNDNGVISEGFFDRLRKCFKGCIQEHYGSKTAYKQRCLSSVLLTPTQAGKMLKTALVEAFQGNGLRGKRDDGDSDKTLTCELPSSVSLPRYIASIDFTAAMEFCELQLLSRAVDNAKKHKGNDITSQHSQSGNLYKLSHYSITQIIPILRDDYVAGVAYMEDDDSGGCRDDYKPLRSSEEEPPNWSCPACTSINEKNSTRCVVCTSPKPMPFGSGASQPLCQWNCTACTFLNEPGTYECSVCNTLNPTSMESTGDRGRHSHIEGNGGFDAETNTYYGRPIPEGHWVCSTEHGGCSLFNPNELYYCKACDKGRPNLASLRF